MSAPFDDGTQPDPDGASPVPDPPTAGLDGRPGLDGGAEEPHGPDDWSAPDVDPDEEIDPGVIGERERREIEDTIFEMRSAAARLEETLLGGKRVLTRREVAQLAGVSTISARKFWRTLGLARVPEGQVAFTVNDATALSEVARIVGTDQLDEETVLSLMRATGQTTDPVSYTHLRSPRDRG